MGLLHLARRRSLGLRLDLLETVAAVQLTDGVDVELQLQLRTTHFGLRISRSAEWSLGSDTQY